MFPKQEQYVALTKYINKLKYDNIKHFKSVNTYPKYNKRKGNQSQPGYGNGKYKNKGRKDMRMRPQDKYKLLSAKEEMYRPKMTY